MTEWFGSMHSWPFNIDNICGNGYDEMNFGIAFQTFDWPRLQVRALTRTYTRMLFTHVLDHFQQGYVCDLSYWVLLQHSV